MRRNWVLPEFGTFKSVAPSAGKPPSFPAVRVHILRDHYNAGRLLRAGETVKLPQPDAADAVALGRAEIA
jgi:hypothetical protein